MFEYLDLEIIAASVLLALSIGTLRATRKSNINWDLRFALLFAISLPLFYMYDANITVLNNIQSVKNGSKLRCEAGDNNYIVSIKDGWEIDKNYFLKESLLIRADKCELYE